MSNSNPEKRLLIYACSVISVIGMLCLAIGVPFGSDLVRQISESTKKDVRQDAEIKHLQSKVDKMELVLDRVSRNGEGIARIEGRLLLWEPEEMEIGKK
tara:strand:+ start:231 stop:527 length:297 start_codon:yes stop_codon:yes gene_type:complete